jgi:L-ascorbate metabolism protein UlaG (beta-lactamase superfamily)
MKTQYFGHSCYQVIINGKKIIFDPFITPNDLAKDIDINTIEADYIIISHGHFDHIADAEAIAKRTGAKIIANFEIVTWYEQKGVEKTHPMNIGGSWEFDFGTVKCVNAVHSSVLPDGTYGGNSMGFVITFEEEGLEKNLYYAGDTALHFDMKLIQEEFDHIDYAFLPVGDNFTMGIFDALKTADWVNADVVIPMHYDTFGYIVLDKKDLQEAFEDFTLEIFEIGQQKELN